MVDKYTPYLTAHPEYSSLLAGIGNDLRWKADGEYFSLHLVNRHGSTVWSSREQPLSGLSTFNEQVSFFADRRDGDKQYFQYSFLKNGFAYRATTRMYFRSTYLNGKKTVLFSGSNAQYQPVLKKSRRVTRSKGYLRTPRVKVPRSSTLRPNPEQIFKGFFQVTEQGPTGYTLNVSPNSRLLFQRTWSGVRTPNFGKLRKSQLPVNPHTVRIEETPTDTLVELNQTIGGPNKGRYDLLVSWGSLHYSSPPEPVHLPQARNYCIRKLIGKNQLGINANLAQDFAQLGQTLRLVGDSSRRIASSLMALRRGNIPLAVKTLFGNQRPRYRKGQWYRKGGVSQPVVTQPTASAGIANNWLAMQYGWKPLLQDIHEAFESLELLTGAAGAVQTVSESGTHDAVSEITRPLWAEPSVGSGKEITFTTTRCKMKLNFRIANSLKAYMAQTGFTNPVNLAWEIIPFSFVADWFLPIGPFLETLSAWDGLEFLDGSQTLFTRSTTVLTLNVTKLSNINPFVLRSHRAARVRTVILLNRSKLTSFPTVTLPSFKNGLASVVHAQNGLALLVKAFLP
jgi:hypothetical protein